MSHFDQFYVNPQKVGSETFALDGEEFIHSARVLRKRVGDWLAAVDGLGHRYQGPIVEIGKDCLVVAIEKRETDPGEPKLRLTLAQAVLKGGHFDWLVEKGTEIGIAVFQPIITERSIVNPTGRLHRWQQKALAAMKQCGRSRCPQVLPPVPFAEALKTAQTQIAFVAHEGLEPVGPTNLVNIAARKHQAVLYVGPEGGFTEEEVQLAIDAGAKPLSLGVRRLRSETAGIVGTIKLLSAAGELG